MSQNLEGFLEEREKKIKEEKQEQINAVAKAEQLKEKRKEQFLNSIKSIISPTMEKLIKTFSHKNHKLQLNSEKLSEIPLELKYLLTLSGNGKPFLIEFNSNKSNVDIAFIFFRLGAPQHPYSKDFSFEKITGNEIENAIVTGLKLLDEEE
jgi:hypothetical protein